MKYLLSILLLLPVNFSLGQNSDYARTNFNENWKFSRFGMHPEQPNAIIEEPNGIEKTTFDDNDWRTLSLPHDWGVEGPFRNDLEANTALLPWRGIGWYRKTFTIPNSDKGKIISIDFDGAMANARVYLNGNYVGEWPYGYSSFRMDLTPYLRFDEKNTIAVRLDTENCDSRWYPGAGIYRNVWLVKSNAVHINHWGTYITTPQITDNKGTVSLEVEVQNENSKLASAEVSAEIFDGVGDKVARSISLDVDIPARKSRLLRFDLDVNKPKRWSIEKPTLYTLITKVHQNGELIHSETTKFGFRTLEFSTEGFFLNGEKTEIKGVCNHHDLGPIGTAFNTRAAERQLEILKEMGCNAIRTSHNPPAPELLDLCDRMGFLVQVEAFDTWRKGKKEKDYNLLFDKWHAEDLRAMVNRDKNHPSVFMWSIGNEVPDQNNPYLAKRLTDIVKSFDPTRPVTTGCNMSFAGFNGFQKSVDVFGYNYNHASYERFFSDTSNAHIPFIANETSSCLSSRGEYFFPVVRGKANDNLPGDGIFYLSSYDQQYPGWGLTPDQQFEMNDKYPRVMGEFVWTGFDYLGEPTPFNSDITNLLNYKDSARKERLKKHLEKIGAQELPSRSSYFGIIDFCGFPKDRYYIYQARWRPDYPMAHILPHWNWPDRIGEKVPVHVYTSGDEAELFLNGKSLGKRKKEEYEYRLRWDDVVYKPGELKVIVWKNGKEWAEDVMRTAGKAKKIQLCLDRAEIKADGADLSFVSIDIIDKKGQLVPRSKTKLNFELEGPGEIVGIGNGDQTSHEPFTGETHHTFNGKCLVIIRSKKDTGEINLKVSSLGLKAAEVQIISN